MSQKKKMMSDHFILGTFQNTQGHITQNVKSNKNLKKKLSSQQPG